MNTILKYALKLGLLNKTLRPITAIYGATEGYKTQVLLTIAALTYASGLLDYIDLETARTSALALLAVAVPTAMDKAKRIMDMVEAGKKKVDSLK